MAYQSPPPPAWQQHDWTLTQSATLDQRCLGPPISFGLISSLNFITRSIHAARHRQCDTFNQHHNYYRGGLQGLGQWFHFPCFRLKLANIIKRQFLLRSGLREGSTFKVGNSQGSVSEPFPLRNMLVLSFKQLASNKDLSSCSSNLVNVNWMAFNFNPLL